MVNAGLQRLPLPAPGRRLVVGYDVPAGMTAYVIEGWWKREAGFVVNVLKQGAGLLAHSARRRR